MSRRTVLCTWQVYIKEEILNLVDFST
jgi:hypothetical protein